jgi:hypothetical protein
MASAACAMYPHHAAAFWNRFWLGTDHYPTRTVIAKLTVNGESVPVFHVQPVRLRVAQGESLRLQAEWTGEAPAEGEVHVRGVRTGASTAWKLKSSTSNAFQLDPQPLVEDVRLRVQLGDAVTDPVEIAVVALPVIELHWNVLSPGTAASLDDQAIPPGARQFAVRAGSRLGLSLACLNKPLKSAKLVLPQGVFSLEKQGDAQWVAPAGTALDNIIEPMNYELTAVDEDGLSPEPRVTGQIRLQPDRAPRVAAAVISKKVLPTARPRITFGAVDDFGIRQVLMTIEITPAAGEPRRDERVVWKPSPSQTGPTNVRETSVLDLAPYQLAKGDQVRVILEAEDERGPAPSQRGQSEPLVFEITDRNGILSSLMETDQQSAKQLDAIILRELGIGGGKK